MKSLATTVVLMAIASLGVAQGTTLERNTVVAPADMVAPAPVDPAATIAEPRTSTQSLRVTTPGGSTAQETAISPSTISYETRTEAAYRSVGVPSDTITKLRDYDVKIRDARISNDTALVRQYYSEQANLLTSQQINGIRTYLRANPVAATGAVTVWEDPAYSTVASPATVVTQPGTVVTREVRTDPIVTRQVQVPVKQFNVPVVVRDPVPVVRQEVQVPAVATIESTPLPTNTTIRTEETIRVRTESESSKKE